MPVKTLELSQVAPGQRLAKPVTDGNGRVMLEAGIILTENHLALLKRKNIAQLAIDTGVEEAEPSSAAVPDAPGSTAPDENTPGIEHAVARIQSIFKNVAADPLMKELLRLALERAAKGQIHV